MDHFLGGAASTARTVFFAGCKYSPNPGCGGERTDWPFYDSRTNGWILKKIRSIVNTIKYTDG